mmetsp:Transcript_41310/g.86669  ORF Transcript_41310/g.86669 Transcript_41310/m.86669 type:complete len:311 (+) Transcript_41310:1-933(+)
MNQGMKKQHQLDSKSILSRMVTATGVNSMRGVTSMQDLQQKSNTRRVASLGVVPESSKLLKLHMKATSNRNFALTRNGASVPSNMMAAAVARTSNRQAGSNPDNTTLPRNVTLRRLDEGDHNPTALGKGANASWEVAHGGTIAAPPMHDNPLLALVSSNKILMHPETKASSSSSMPKHNSKSSKEYSIIGDRIPKEYMPHVEHSEMKMAFLVSKMSVNDTAFVKRSSGRYYSYSKVTHKDSVSITFVVNAHGDSKTFDLLNVGKSVRIIKEEEMVDIRRRMVQQASFTRGRQERKTKRETEHLMTYSFER